MMLSVRLQCYNHAEYIKQALRGIVIQETTFPFEVVIGDDFSTDNSLETIRNFVDDYSGSRISFTVLDRKKGDSYHKVRIEKGRLYNFYDIIQNCTGKYIALLDGDDYWTDPSKLQKQVDFLEGNEDYAICFHRVKVLTKKGFVYDQIEKRYDSIQGYPIIRRDLIEQGNLMHTASVVYRNQGLDFPFEFFHSPIGDYFLHVMNAQFGKIERLDDYMAVYRSGNGLYSGLKSRKMKWRILESRICLISHLDSNEAKELVLIDILKRVKKFESQSFDKDFLLKNVSTLDLLKTLLTKLKYKLVG